MGYSENFCSVQVNKNLYYIKKKSKVSELLGPDKVGVILLEGLGFKREKVFYTR